MLQIVDDERPTHRRRRWLVPAVAAAAVMAILGTWVLVTTPEDEEPVASVPDPTAPTATPDTIASSTTGERPVGCLEPTVLTLTPVGADTGETTQTFEMVTESFGVSQPTDCRLILETDDDLPDPTVETTMVTAASSLILDGFPEDGGADGTRLSVVYTLVRYDPADGVSDVLGDGPLTVRSTTPFGYSTPSDPTLPSTPPSFEVPLPADERCMLLYVRWSLSGNAQGSHVAFIGESSDACLPAS
ncbi:MAG: hypothetical protein NTZ21_12065 [Actinobacteria bacterium]|nr:hypothetical protein [Actinomycetota bacterium]